MSSTEQVRPQRRSARPLITSADAMEAAERGYDEPIDLMDTNVSQATRAGLLDPISGLEFDQIAEYEVFMQDPVIIIIPETTDENAPRVVFVGVNGDSRWLPRGRPIRLQRKFVEKLAQAQEMKYSTQENTDRNSDDGFKVLRKLASSYQFQVLKDDHPMGRKWLMRVTRQGAG